MFLLPVYGRIKVSKKPAGAQSRAVVSKQSRVSIIDDTMLERLCSSPLVVASLSLRTATECQLRKDV